MLALAPLLLACPADAQVKNGFNLKNASIDPEQIHRGGPPRDGIPAIDRPRFTQADDTGWLRPEDRVLGLELGGLAKAYPIRILDWHEIVNDRFGDRPVVVSFCPLCGTGMAFDARIDGETRTFGVSGLLYNSDVLLYDRGTESLWSQIEMEAITGPMKGTELTLLPMQNTTWKAWRKEHPETLVLSRETGFRRSYDATPYEGYGTTPSLYFPVGHRDLRLQPKAPVLGLELAGTSKAYPFDRLDKALQGKSGTLTDTVAGRKVEIRYDAEAGAAAVFDEKGEELPSVRGFWFAWAAFHPDTEVFEAE